MRKAIYYLFPLFFCLASCIQDEAPNAECDLLKVVVHAQNPSEVFYSLNDTVREVLTSESKVVFDVKEGADLSRIGFDFELTPGATIDTFRVTVGGESVLVATTRSEDKKWSRQYTVSFKSFSGWNGLESFEDVAMFTEKGTDKYYVWKRGEDENFWATGNPGYKLSRSSAKPDEYPTVSAEGYVGKGVQLITRSTGALGSMVSKPIAAGNLFVGRFDVTTALKNALASTEFGVPFQKKPKKVSFMAKFKPGDVFKDKKGNTINKKDKPDFYAVMYRNIDSEGKSVLLHGDDAKTNPNIVAHAFMGDAEAAKLSADVWKEVSIPFTFVEDIDDAVLANFGYNLAIVFSSSIDGAEFSGAVGSTFTVDELKLEFDE